MTAEKAFRTLLDECAEIDSKKTQYKELREAIDLIMKAGPVDEFEPDAELLTNVSSKELLVLSNTLRNDGALLLGSLIAKCNKIEREFRHSYAALVHNFSYDKNEFRRMIVGYYVDDDGYATDRDGNRIETEPGYLISNNPSKLYTLEESEKKVSIVELHNGEKREICVITPKDGQAIKELLANFDITLGDGINRLYLYLSDKHFDNCLVSNFEITVKKAPDKFFK